MVRSLHWLAVFSVLASAPAAEAKVANDISWGKPGVPLDQYARDATECADGSRSVAVAIKPNTLRQLDGMSSAQLISIVQNSGRSADSNALAYVANMTDYKSANDIARRSNTFGASYVNAARVDVTDELQAALDQCLTDRGYVRVRLTGDQMKALAKLRKNTAARTAYLHALGSDPAVIERQRQP